MGTDSASYTDSDLADGDSIACVLTSDDPCASPLTATATAIEMTVIPVVTPTVSIAADPGATIEWGTPVTFTATPGGEGANPHYEWTKNGAVVGTDSATYTPSSLANGDVIVCVLTPSVELTCLTTPTATSAAITMVVEGAPTVLAGWDVSACSGYGSSPLAATVVAANTTAGGLTRGAGVTQSGTAAARGWGGTAWNALSTAAAITANQYATFTIKPNTGHKVSFVSISKFDYRRSGTGAPVGMLQYSKDGTTFTDIGSLDYQVNASSVGSIAAIDLTGVAGLQNVASSVTVTFRIVNHGASSSTGTWYLYDVATSTANDFEIMGSVIASDASVESDIVVASSFSESANVAYASYQDADITLGNSLEVARFTLQDGGVGASDTDSRGTILSDLTLSLAGHANLRRVALYVNGVEVSEQAAASSVTFAGLAVTAPDNGAQDLSVRATYAAVVTDNAQVRVTVISATPNSAGSIFAAANAGGAQSSIDGDANRIAVTADRLAFTSVPATVTAGQNFSATVQARDVIGNVDLDSTVAVTVALASGSGTLSGGGAQDLNSGTRAFSTLRYNSGGTFTLQATAAGLTGATSGAISAEATPVVISGFLANPTSTDSPYEYVQLRAVTDVDFSVTPISVVVLNNGDATVDGWTAGLTTSYKFNITSGTMSENEVAYVGGSGKRINGSVSPDISSAKWLRAINTGSTGGDGFGSANNNGVLGNGGANADGIAIFMGTSPTGTQTPADAVFYGSAFGSALVDLGTDGYVLPQNDRYSGGYLQSGSYLYPDLSGEGSFVRLTGTYNVVSRQWTTARTASVVAGPTGLSQIESAITVTTPVSVFMFR